MIPLKLTIQGLYSYREPQTIDFEMLTTSQLFGIFGEVGSGKSSILEAIVFALYNRSERLNKGDERYYNMLNLQSQRLAIDFVFRAAGRDSAKYRFTVSAQRKKKQYEKVEIKERGYYRWENNAWLPVEVTDPADIVGMTYDNFMQTVIIPQGKFREFIDHTPKNRTDMLKELFRLEKFDLSHKTNHLRARVKSTITDLEARLSEIGTVSEEDIEATRKEAYEYEVSLLRQDKLLQEAEVACQFYEQLNKQLGEQEAAQRELHQLHAQRVEYQTRERQLREYRAAELYFNDRFERLEKLANERNARKRTYDQLLADIRQSAHQLTEAKLAWETARQDYERRDTMRIQCRDLEILIRIHRAKREQATRQTEEKRTQEAYEQSEQRVATGKQRLKTIEAQLGEVEQALEQQAVLRAVDHWHQQQIAYEAEQQRYQQQVAEQQQAQQTIDQRKNDLLATYQWRENGSFARFFDSWEKQSNALKDEVRQTVGHQGELQARIGLAEQAQRLSSGDACPLCGATDHPAVAHPAALAQELSTVEGNLTQLRHREEQWESLAKIMQQLQSEYQIVNAKLDSLLHQQQTIQERIKTHAEAFCWDDYRTQDAATIRRQMQQADRQRAEQQKLRERRTDEQQQQEQAERQLREHQQQRQQVLSQQHAQQSLTEGYREQLQVLSYERHQSYSETQLQTSLENGQAKLAQVEQQYEATRQRHQQYETQLGILNGKQEEQVATLRKLTQQAADTEEEILKLCREKEFTDIDHVQSVIDLKLDKEAEQEAIVTYKSRLHTAEKTVERLKQVVKGQPYDALKHQEADRACLRLKQSIEQMQEARTLAIREIRDQERRLTKTKELTTQLKEQRLREDRLKTLASLFRGSGFVNYASSVLLRDVCQAANVRFKQLTRNNLSLDLNQKNDFIVRDHLNNGRTRLLKTLSGGQIFQAALCLALALAENIKALNQAEQSFFFLDEGFGSLDKASLRVVFDTLKSLRKENRIVGIISHVEELQQEIDVYLTIENDRERGSVVRASWE